MEGLADDVSINLEGKTNKLEAMRLVRFLLMIIASWVVMTFTHETGHVIGGICGGGTLVTVDLLPWHLPYSIFEPDPFPLVTLWSGLILGILMPISVALIVQRQWIWFIAHFRVLANGVYVGTGWFSKDRYLDTPQLLEHGASSTSIAIYCMMTIGFGYIGFRQSCISALSDSVQLTRAAPKTEDKR